MEILFNQVVIKASRHDHELILTDGNKLFLDNSYKKGHHMVRTGTVTHVPKHLHFEYFDLLSMEYDTDMEVKVGDELIFHHLAIDFAKKDNYHLAPDHYPIRYDSIFVAIRNGQVIPVNGNVIVEPMVEAISPVFSQTKTSVHHGVVKYLGTPVRGYFMTPDGTFTDKGIDINVGDHVVYSKADCVPLEFKLHQTLDKGVILYRMRRKDIIATL
jgi:hypothetical protein